MTTPTTAFEQRQPQPLPIKGQSVETFSLNTDSIPYLMKSLLFADSTFATEIENALIQCGKKAVPFLAEGLNSENTQVASSSAMAIIRLGQVAEPIFSKTMLSLDPESAYYWRFQFVQEQLCISKTDLPKIAAQAATAERIK